MWQPIIVGVDLSPAVSSNALIASRLEEVGELLEQQGASPFRVAAYQRAAQTVRQLARPVGQILRREGFEGLEALPTIGRSIGRAIQDLVVTGRLPMLDRLRGESDPIALLATVPGIGPKRAHLLHDRLGIDSLEDLELAAHDGRLARVRGFGPKRVAAVRDTLTTRLARVRNGRRPAGPEPAVAELLDVDREYRDRAGAGKLRRIAPRRFNPHREAWLPILHTRRSDREYTVLYSNTERAHRLGKTRDWVVIYCDGDRRESQYTVVTGTRGSLEGYRVVRGREAECEDYYERPEGLQRASADGQTEFTELKTS